MEIKERDLTPDELKLVQEELKKRVNEGKFRVSIVGQTGVK